MTRAEAGRRPLAVAVAQPSCVSGDIGANALTHAAAIREARSRVVVFPEMSLTGYELDAPAVDPADTRLAPIVDACRASRALALVGAPVHGSGGSHIGMLAIDGTGATMAYRKMWLSSEESRYFIPGERPAVIDVDGWRLGLAICKDTGVDRHASETAALGMDAYVAGVLESFDDAAVPEARARRVAADHHVWVAIASFAGATGGGYDRSAGGSGIWAPDGTAVTRAGALPGAIGRATLTAHATPAPRIT